MPAMTSDDMTMSSYWLASLNMQTAPEVSRAQRIEIEGLVAFLVNKRVLNERTSVSHFYSGGDICEKTGKRRQTEVKLKCLENSSSPAQVSLYLLEPRTCHYILGVESPLICEILPLADENGLIKSVPTLSETPEQVATKEEDDNVIKLKDVNKFGFD